MDKIEVAIEIFFQRILNSLPGFLLAFFVLILGFWLIKVILKIIRLRFEARSVDLSLRDFILSIIKFILYTMLLISVASMIGIQTTSFIAVLGAASLSIGLALQGSLSNFAGGVLILIFKPFRVGDYIHSDTGAVGDVEKIDILYTTLRNAEGLSVFVPNGPLANSVISNYSTLDKRRIENQFILEHDTDIRIVRSQILKVLNADPRILKSPAPIIKIDKITELGVYVMVYFWTPKAHFVDVLNTSFEVLKESLEEADVKFSLHPKM